MLNGEVADGRGSSPFHGGAGDLLLAGTLVTEEMFFAFRQLADL